MLLPFKFVKHLNLKNIDGTFACTILIIKTTKYLLLGLKMAESGTISCAYKESSTNTAGQSKADV